MSQMAKLSLQRQGVAGVLGMKNVVARIDRGNLFLLFLLQRSPQMQ